MRVRQIRPALPRAPASCLVPTLAYLGLTFVLVCACQPSARAQRPQITEQVRYYTVDGRVSLPDDKPAVRAWVRLAGRGGVNRETATNDNGRFEFAEVPAGVYSLTAHSLADPSLSSGTVEINTERTSTGTLTATLSLREPAAESRPKPGVVSAPEAGQRVPREARKAFARALELKDDNRPEEALASFDRAVELYPGYFQALAGRGDLRVGRRELRAAAADFERALRVNARYAPALRGAGYCLLEGREFGRAADYLGRAAAIEPANAGTHLLLGVANLELGRRDEARRALRRALKIDARGAARAHIHLANLYAREGLYRQAADELSLYLDEAVTDPEVAEMRKVEASWRALAKQQ